MAAAIALGGFTGPEADTLGYAIRKKKSSVLRAQKERFVTQAAERGVQPGVIDAVFKAFEPFERYGFNKAHATCYGLIAYQTAYLKANYTVEYMTSVLSAFRSSEDKVAAAVAECRRLGIEVRPPDVHQSQLEFTVEGDAIRFGLLAVKNVGQGAIESIIAARAAEGPFRSLTDFCTRIDLRLTNKKVLESLAKVGALNEFGHPAQILMGLDEAVAAGQATQHDRITGQVSLFDMGAADAALFERPLPSVPEAPVRERLRWEKELLGLYLSEHPMGEVADRVGRLRDGLLGRPQGRVTRRPAARPRRDRGRLQDRGHAGPGDDGRCHHGGSPGLDRGRRLPEALRADRPDLVRGFHPPRGRPGRPPGRGRLAPGRSRDPLGRRHAQGSRGLRPRRGGRRPGQLPAEGRSRPGRPERGERGHGHAQREWPRAIDRRSGRGGARVDRSRQQWLTRRG